MFTELTPALTPSLGPLAGIRVVGTGILIAQPFIGTKLAEFGAEVSDDLPVTEEEAPNA